MIDPPQIVQIAQQHTAVIHLVATGEEMQDVMGPGIDEVMSTIAAQGIAPTGAWFTHHLQISDDTFDFEISMPVASPVAPAGRVRPGAWPAMTAVRTTFHGTYEGLPEAWGEFDEWIAVNGHTPADDLYEQYVLGPESSEDPADWRTELTRPLK